MGKFDSNSKDILTLLVYTKTQSEIYQSKSNETLNILTNFKKNLIIDRANFESDKEFLKNATTIEESKLKEDFLIEQAMVVGDKQKFVSALIVPAEEAG